MDQEKLKQAMEAISKANIHIAGDFVVEKRVVTKIDTVNVGAGGSINVADIGKDAAALSDSPKQDNEQSQENKEDLFRFIHPSISEEQEWEIHNMVKRLVSRHGIQEICQYLKEMKKEKKILLPQSLSVAYNELVRMGMPSKDGFNERTFQKYYR